MNVSDDFVIEADRLGKKYLLRQKERYKVLRETLSEWIATPFRRVFSKNSDEKLSGLREFWALRDVSLKVRKGEVLGVIGPNGAGKTTLLKLLSRITEPTEGSAVIRGRVGSLLEVGTGFHPELSGRENIYLNGAILGMKRFEIERKFDEIVEFSGIEEFLETPVKRYSSGMYVRLAFAVAAHLEPEILLVDEVLAVGDASFQKKCLGKMSQVAGSGRTIFFVSHNMSAIRSLCSRAICLDGGRIVSEGEVEKVVLDYLSRNNGPAQIGKTDLLGVKNRTGSGRVKMSFFEARAGGGDTTVPRTGADAEFLLGYEVAGKELVATLSPVITVLDDLGDSLFVCMPALTPLKEFRKFPPSGLVRCRVRNLPLIPGRYRVNLALKDEAGVTDQISNAASFEVIDGGDSGFSALPSGRWGKIVVPQEWDLAESAVLEGSHGR